MCVYIYTHTHTSCFLRITITSLIPSYNGLRDVVLCFGAFGKILDFVEFEGSRKVIFVVSPCPLEYQQMLSNRDFYMVWSPLLWGGGGMEPFVLSAFFPYFVVFFCLIWGQSLWRGQWWSCCVFPCFVGISAAHSLSLLAGGLEPRILWIQNVVDILISLNYELKRREGRAPPTWQDLSLTSGRSKRFS